MAVRIHMIDGGGGVRLHVRDWGPEDAPPVVLIHGWAQHHMAWEAQTGSDLTRDLRLIALDLRGHGASDKPRDPAAYADGALWAADVAAILATLALERPILAGWSYGGLAIGQYLQAHGDAALGAILLVGAVPAMGAARPGFMMGPSSPAQDRDLVTDDQPRLIAATRRFVRAGTHRPLPPETEARWIAFNMLCPPHARRGLAAAAFDTRPAFARATRPVEILHGLEDRVVSPDTARDLARVMPHARLTLMEATGHAPFVERPDAFNATLRALAAQTREPT